MVLFGIFFFHITSPLPFWMTAMRYVFDGQAVPKIPVVNNFSTKFLLSSAFDNFSRSFLSPVIFFRILNH